MEFLARGTCEQIYKVPHTFLETWFVLLKYFLGLEVHTTPKGIFLKQHKYTADLITLAGFADATVVDTHMEVNLKLHKEEGDLLSDPPSTASYLGARFI